MRVFIQVLGIILGLIVIGIGLWLIPLWEGVTGIAIGLVLFCIAALLLAPQRIYRESWVRTMASSFGIILALVAIFCVVIMSLGIAHVGDFREAVEEELGPFYWTIPMLMILFWGIGAFLSFFCAVVLFARIFIARNA
jgi:hypothetical protein